MPSFSAIGIVARDIAESSRFYRTLGIDVGEPAAGDDHFETTLPNGVRIMWDTEELIRKLDPEWQRPARGHSLALAFACESPADVDAIYARLLDVGFTGKDEPYDAFWGHRYATAIDPDGNPVDLFAAL